MSHIKRAVLVVEYEDDCAPGSMAVLVVIDGGVASILSDATGRWAMNNHGGLDWVEDYARRQKIDIRIAGNGMLTHFENAEDLFSMWNGPQPTPPAQLEQGTPELEEG